MSEQRAMLMSFDEAVRIIEAETQESPGVTRALNEGLGYVLAEPITAVEDFPAFTNSAVDGFALHWHGECPSEFEVVATIRPGESANHALQSGQAARVFTGSPLPPATAAVAMQEDCQLSGSQLVLKRKSPAGEHVRPKGEGFAKGELLYPKSTPLNSAVIGIMLSQNIQSVKVHGKPKVAILTTGNELIREHQERSGNSVRDSNGPALRAALQELGIEQISLFQSQDDIMEISSALHRAIREHDVVLTCGGASVGEHDLLPQAITEVGGTIKVRRANIKPGKPFTFATSGEKQIFILPGNPHSAMVCFYLFARPALRKMMGHEKAFSEWISATSTIDFDRHQDRESFVPGHLRFSDGKVLVAPLLDYSGSQTLWKLSTSNCIVRLTESKSNRDVDILPLQQ